LWCRMSDPFWTEDPWPDLDLFAKMFTVYVHTLDIDEINGNKAVVKLKFTVDTSDLDKLYRFNDNSKGFILPAAEVGK
jgi:hypothetical protein